MSRSNTDTSYDRVIRPRRAWYDFDWARLVHYRDLLWTLVRRDFVARYQQTILGPAWFVLQPLITTVAFTLVFGHALHTPTDGVPPFLFYLCGMLAWGYFSSVIGSTGTTFTANAQIFSKVYFPRIITPLAVTISSLVAFAVQTVTFLVFYVGMILFSPSVAALIHPNWLVLAVLPLVLAQTAFLGLGCGLFLSALSGKYRDLQHMVPMLIQVWLFATPVIYPLSQLGPRAQWVAAFNPLTSVVELFRLGFFGVGTVTPGFVTVSLVSTGVMLLLGFALFQRVERTVVDTV